ncbi:MAG: hypothetical protein LAO08_06540 [Acidobacteriia bacterium]|nr:hypothetical protein [Terriglobia bacterium]
MTTNHLPESNYLRGERQAELRSDPRSEELDAFGDLLMEQAYIESNWIFSVESELAVVGHDPEYADMENPRGEVVRERYFMVGTTPNGRQYRFGWERTAALAEAAFQYLAPPVEQWSLWRCIYGSDAYVQDNCELQQLADEMDEDFAGSGRNWMVEAPEVAVRIINAGVR